MCSTVYTDDHLADSSTFLSMEKEDLISNTVKTVPISSEAELINNIAKAQKIAQL